MIFTNNFHPDRDKKLLCTCGHELCDQRSVSQAALDKVQLIRRDIKQPMTITSGGRCQYHLDELTKSSPGDHQLQEAVDVACSTIGYETKLKVLAGRHGATRVAGGAYCGFVHIAFTQTDRTDVPTWSYQ